MRNVLRGGGLALLGFCAILAVLPAVGQAAATACSHCVFETSFTTTEGWALPEYYQLGGLSNHNHCRGTSSAGNLFDAAQSGVSRGSDNDTGDPDHLCDIVFAAANHSNGRGGLGFRHYRVSNGTDGTNHEGGGVRFSHGATSVVWLRWYTRWSTGFDWTNGTPPGYSKDFRDDSSGVIFDWFGTFTIWKSSIQLSSKRTWTDVFGRPSNGSWHCFEVYMDASKGAATIWIDGVQEAAANSGLTLGGSFASWRMSNQADVTKRDGYTDFDDFAASFTQRIGCFGGSVPPSPAAPTALKIIR
jgi:hypothetical protein